MFLGKRECLKCKDTKKLHRHHVTYEPCYRVYLCRTCHGRITSLNTIGSYVAHGSKKHRPEYTNKLRLTLWAWFLANTWPDKRRLSRDQVRSILSRLGFEIKLRGKSYAGPCGKPTKVHSGKKHITSQHSTSSTSAVFLRNGVGSRPSAKASELTKRGQDQLKMLNASLVASLTQSLG